ncbi:MAG: HAMP domain-containing protein [Oscillospiraceae bacterium]|nr:HAMP domain-containing protein [Oscillospiraceae bacterium]
MKKKISKVKKIKVEKIIRSRWFRQVMFLVFSFLLAFFVQAKYYKPNLGTFLGSNMDASGNVYSLSVKKDSNQYKITKIDKNGIVKFENYLEATDNESSAAYRNIEVDLKGNIYLVCESRYTNAVVSTPDSYPIAKETVLMYDSNGVKIKQVILFDFVSTGNMSTVGYIRKLQIVDQKLVVIGAEKNRFDIVTINPYVDESPSKDYSFNVNPPANLQEAEAEWANDVSVISSGKLFYTTKRGDFLSVDTDGKTVDLRSILPNFENSIVSMSIDKLDNIYFTDVLTGTFYKLNTKSINVTPIYSLEDSLKIDDLKIKDLRRIRAIDVDDFYAASKNFENSFHARLSTTNYVTSNLRYAFFPWGLIYTFAGTIALILATLIIWSISKRALKRVSLAIRITGLFLPFFLIVMFALIFVTYLDSSSNYSKFLNNSQNVWTKILSEKIDGNLLENLAAPSNYMSPEYAKTDISLKASYVDLNDKISDISDYVVLYVAKGNQLYSAIDNRYLGKSKSYSELKFANPDMVPAEISLIDCFLETNEITNLYSIWDKLRNGEEKIAFAKFKDVHGGLSASFAPISNSNGRIVGFVGNFIDEKIHVKDELLKILIKHSLIIGATTILVFLYLCIIIIFALYPLRKLGKGLDSMINGRWKTRVTIHANNELSDIASTFNEMSSRLEKYTDNLIDLNSKYLRFVPKELLSLTGKEKITQVKINEKKLSELSMLYITFNIAPVRNTQENFENFMFNALQESYENIFKIIESGRGIIQNFSNLGAMILFPTSPKDAVTVAFQIFEAKIHPKIKENMRLGLGFGDALIGIIGDNVRRGISVVSDEFLRLIKIDININKFGVNLVATESIIKQVSQESSIAYRFLGKFRDVAGTSWVKIYEIIDSVDVPKKELYIGTKETFEKAINNFLNGDFETARNLFADVLQQNSDDKAALYYLNVCEQKVQNLSSSDIFDI